MRFVETGLPGAFLIEIDPLVDGRGLFARTYCEREFRDRGIGMRMVQCSTSFNARRNTVRGMHFQAEPFAEDKLVRCTRGAIYDVIVDMRQGSPTRLKWFAAELSQDNRRSIFLPKGFAHGFKTLTDHSEIFYQMSAFYEPAAGQGVRWNDPALNIDWPEGEPLLSERDKNYPDIEI
ncbi:MAG: dTDP-4-dehydrorhamnose 3,5-epimerase [Betaproteobacteria bacterium]|nr:dTDP-4-dehydrorhamnose 3,5-epimerase [Betaproteobacteria bacterium]